MNTAAEVRSGERFAAVAACTLFVLSFLVYANTFTGRFVWDDTSSFLYHEHVKDPSKFFQLFAEDQHAFGRGQGNFYRPLLSVTFMVDHMLSAPSTAGPDLPSPFMFHLSSVLWHAYACIALFALLGRLGASLPVRTLTAAVWTVHPLHTEAVAYMSGRADSMSAALMFTGIWLALSPGSGLRKHLATAGSLVFYALALLSKESSFIYPVLLGICLWASRTEASKPAGHSRWARLAPLAGSVAVLGLYGVLRSTVLRFAEGGAGPGTGFWERCIETLQSFGRYIELIVFPTGLHMQRTLAGADSMTTLGGVAALAAAAGLLVYGVVRRRHRIATGMAWFLSSWFPISGIFPLNAPMAEHWMYVPMAGLLWAVLEFAGTRRSSGNDEYRSFAPAVYVIACVWVVLLLGLSVHRNYDWRSNQALFRSTLAENPNSTMVRFNLALSYEDAGNLPGARRQYQEMLRVFESRRNAGTHSGFRPEEVEAMYSLGNIAMLNDERARAGRHFQRLTNEVPVDDHSRPIVARAAFQLGRMYLESGNAELGRQFIQEAVRVDPSLEQERRRLLTAQ